MKKVLVTAYACLPNHGSEEGNGWNYASLLAENGFEIHCLTRELGRQTIEPLLAEGACPNLTVHYVQVPNWVEAFYFKGLIGMYFHYLYWQWAAYKMGKKLDLTINFDLVQHATYGSIQLGSFMYKLGKPFVLGPMGGGQQSPKVFKPYFGRYWAREQMREFVSLMLQYFNPGFYRAVQLADQVIVTNNDTLKLARKLRPTRPIHRMPDAGVSRAFLPKTPIEHKPGATFNLLWVGRLMPRKGLELSIQALGQVNPALPIKLTIVGGKGEMAELVPQYLERYGVQDRVEWVGQVPYHQVKAYYQRSDMFLFTSLRDSCPHQLMEAMAYSLPIVTLDLHGQAEQVSDETGIRVPVREADQVVADLARAIEWMYEHPEQRAAMGRAGYKYARSLAWDTKVEELIENVYMPILNAKSANNSVPVKMQST